MHEHDQNFPVQLFATDRHLWQLCITYIPSCHIIHSGEHKTYFTLYQVSFCFSQSHSAAFLFRLIKAIYCSFICNEWMTNPLALHIQLCWFNFCHMHSSCFLFSMYEWPTKTGQQCSPHRQPSPSRSLPAPTLSSSPLLVILQLQCLYLLKATFLPYERQPHFPALLVALLNISAFGFRSTLFAVTVQNILCSFQSGFFYQSSWNFR